jgi:hypothetical protein
VLSLSAKGWVNFDPVDTDVKKIAALVLSEIKTGSSETRVINIY